MLEEVLEKVPEEKVLEEVLEEEMLEKVPEEKVLEKVLEEVNEREKIRKRAKEMMEVNLTQMNMM